ncbi:SDR family oxidoreductase [Aerococcaceae bacterium DSM 111176]|nr:SDR family oxidoreductase [Aerococcaceae bacterium DSM 111176]
MKQVFVIGAHGKVAKHFADFVAKNDNLSEKAMIRKSEQADFFQERQIEPVLLDLAATDEDELAKAMEGSDVVIFSAGAGGSGTDNIFTIDLDGAIKAMIAAEMAGIKRFIMVSTFRTGREWMQQDTLRSYTIAKHYADEWLRNRTELDWTIVHPGVLIDEPGTGKVKVGGVGEVADIDLSLTDNAFGDVDLQVPRQDIAHVLQAILFMDSTIGKEIEVIQGETPIEEAIQTI